MTTTALDATQIATIAMLTRSQCVDDIRLLFGLLMTTLRLDGRSTDYLSSTPLEMKSSAVEVARLFSIESPALVSQSNPTN